MTLLPLVPPVLLQLVKAPSVTPTDLRSVRSIFYGGAPVGAELEDEWDEKFPGIHRMQGNVHRSMRGAGLEIGWG